MSKCVCGLDKYFLAKRKLVIEEHREGNTDSTMKSTRSSTHELADFETSTSDSDIEDQLQELDSEPAINDKVSYSYMQFLILNMCNVDHQYCP